MGWKGLLLNHLAVEHGYSRGGTWLLLLLLLLRSGTSVEPGASSLSLSLSLSSSPSLSLSTASPIYLPNRQGMISHFRSSSRCGQKRPFSGLSTYRVRCWTA
uniref:Putative secreted protein n=1 Tax=Anopheles darlingi TaxID=43151 RepID=A0A2M4D1T1_ANODA